MIYHIKHPVAGQLTVEFDKPIGQAIAKAKDGFVEANRGNAKILIGIDYLKASVITAVPPKGSEKTVNPAGFFY